MASTPIAIVCTGLLGLLLFTLGFKTSMARLALAKKKGTEADVHNMSRAHGNTSEYAPMFGILFLLVHYLTAGRPGLFLNLTMVIATVSRIGIAYGLANPVAKGKNIPRFYGALGTYVTGIVLSGSVLFLWA